MDISDSMQQDDSGLDISSKEQEVMAVQSYPQNQSKPRQTLKLLAQIGKQQVLVLVDSGSGGTFVSEHLVNQLKLHTVTCEATTFRSANGGMMLSELKVPQLH